MGTGRRAFLVCLLAVAPVVTTCRDSSSSSSRGPAPSSCTITGVAPGAGDPQGGTILVITGTEFENDLSLSVVVGANSVRGYWISDTEVRAMTPPDTRLPTGGPVDIQVISTNRVCSLQGGFTYLADCTITEVLPETGSSAGGETVRILGANFENVPSLTVEFGGVAVPGIWVSPGAIEAVTPSDPRTPAGGPVDIVVTSPNRDCTLVDGYTYIYDLVGAATVEIDGNPIAFATAEHYYDVGWGAGIVELFDSTPPGWFLSFSFFGSDVDPGCFDTCFDFIFVDLTTPMGDWYWEVSCVYDVAGCFTQFTTTPGGFSAGTFFGVVENAFIPNDTLVLTNGQFSAERR